MPRAYPMQVAAPKPIPQGPTVTEANGHALTSTRTRHDLRVASGGARIYNQESRPSGIILSEAGSVFFIAIILLCSCVLYNYII